MKWREDCDGDEEDMMIAIFILSMMMMIMMMIMIMMGKEEYLYFEGRCGEMSNGMCMRMQT